MPLPLARCALSRSSGGTSTVILRAVSIMPRYHIRYQPRIWSQSGWLQRNLEQPHRFPRRHPACAPARVQSLVLIMGLNTVRFLAALSLFCGLVDAQKMPGFDVGALDKNADPCVNFYQYACGGWLAGNPVPG